ncbi:Holliday junction resolvase RuvX [Myroides marinus]|uniref:Holliday junction resolvase RuvX n=1 Tax=Myroides marinus TaxID=703342 RepID=UPI000742048C|nr:Holliday junction resolvase RuvX [Myroides marinus]KUF43385.1 crossover junction endodeoxyribonuclease RuvA [Myroides marinus]MDM1347360.1 Holliday junction resolvase RuvX [Myroides marinus]MDM1349680.1 Holliday junction resolvase RuvX [Myroides marinus]MDM1354497.1 Holliday junction resolvase RuvX [Myroides marinus]MDM1356889.1 Holliday junction resolvase RuvX [Myroides marinus]
MARLLSIDFGKKRTGIAVTDDFQIIASGLTTVETEQLLPFLKDYFSKENVEKVIIGEPKRLNNEPSEVVPLLNSFIEKFKQSFPTMPVERIDERFTSKMAFQTMIDSGLKKKQRQNKALIDEIAATIILQDYMRK